MKVFTPSAVLALTSLLSLSQAECPQMKDIPVMYGTQFTCTQVWKDHGDELPVNACNGDTYIKADHEDGDAGWGSYFPWGSIMVKPGCTLYMFKGEEFSGGSQVITGPEAVYENDWGTSDWFQPPGPTSWKCRCVQEPVDCSPVDGWEVVLVCDNTLGLTSTTCSYSQTVGTQFSDSVSEGMSVDTTVKEEMSAQFWGLFSLGLGVSESTGYDWGHTSESTKSEQVTVTVQAEAPPGYVLVIEQTTASCGESEVRTERFRTSHQDSQGSVLHRDIQ